ncbi:MAG: transposase [Oscillospiraceae bacterium]|nr:transposase [Oscillospiraceae bacterium]
MRLARKIRLLPTPEQEVLFWKSAGVARWAYNYFLSENERVWQEYLANGETGAKSVSEGAIRKYINNVLKKTTHTWLSEVGSNVMKQAVKDAHTARDRFFRGLAEKPCYKSRHKEKPSFYVNYESLSRKNGGFHGEKLGFVRTSEPLPKLKKGEKYSNPHISFDGKYWYLSVGYEVPAIKCNLTDESIGIDLGIKDLAICSNGKTYRNINKSHEVRRLEKVLKRKQRKLSRILKQNISGYKTVGDKRFPLYIRPLQECRNFQKQKKVIKLLHRRLANIRNNYLHQTTTEIVKTKPSRIVMETLHVKNMMKNRHLAKAVQNQKFYEFKRQIAYKCQKYGIALVEVPTFYPSSKTCSCCGCIKRDLKLSDRIYKCSQCGLVIDRDFNASLNLANY